MAVCTLLWTRPGPRAVVIAAALVVLHAAAGWADEVSVPGEWYDQDKTNDGIYDPARNRLGGMGWNYWLDDDGNGVYTYGEGWREHHPVIDPNDNQEEDPGEAWGDWHLGDDDSCWAAAAGNLVRYVGAGDRYMGWVYEGTWADGSTWTWAESGHATEALEAEGFDVHTVDNQAGGGVWAIDPAAWIEARLADGLPVVIACGWENDFGTGPFYQSTHAVTVYAIDTAAQTLTLADNSREFGNEDSTEFDYTFDSGVLRMPNYRGVAHLNKASTFEVTEWQGAGAGGADGDWHDPANWSGGQVPDVAHPRLLPRMEFTESGTAYLMGIAQAQMLIVRGTGGVFLVTPAGNLTLGNLHLADGEVIAQGPVEAHRADIVSGHLNVHGGTVSVTFDADGGSGDVTCGGAVTVQDSGTFDVADDFNTAPGGCTLTVESGSTMTVAGDLGLAGGDLVVLDDGTFDVGGDLVGWPGTSAVTATSGNPLAVTNDMRVETGSDVTVHGHGTLDLGGYLEVEGQGVLRLDDTTTTLSVARDATVDGTVDAGKGTTLHVDQMLYVGAGATATASQIILTDATLEVGGQAFIGVTAPGQVTGTRSGINVDSLLAVGDAHEGKLDVAGGSVTCKYLHVGHGPGSLGTVTIEAAADKTPTVRIGGAAPKFVVGYEGLGEVFHRAGVVTRAGPDPDNPDPIDPTVILGLDAESEGAYDLADGELHAHDLTVGKHGDGTFTQTGGIVRVGHWAYLGMGASADGAYDLLGGTFEVNQMGNGPGTGTLNVDGGTFLLTGLSASIDHLNIGENAPGALRLTDKTLLVDRFTVGDSADGAFTQAGGGTTVDSYLAVGVSESGTFDQVSGDVEAPGVYLARNTGSEAAYTIDDGTLTSTGTLCVGEHGRGTFTHRGAAKVFPDELYVGFGDYAVDCTYRLESGELAVAGLLELGTWDADGTFELTGGIASADEAVVGNRGEGTIVQASGDWTVTGSLTLGLDATGQGHYDLGGGSLETGGTVVGEAGGGTVDQSGGTHRVLGDLVVGRSGTASYYTLSGIDTRLEADRATVGDGATAAFTQTGGFVKVAQDVFLGNAAGGDGTYHLDGGVLSIGGHVYCGYAGGTGTLAMGGGTLEGSANTVYVATPADRLTGWGTVATGVQNTGTLRATGGTLALKGTYVGRGSVAIDPGATLALWDDAAVSGPTVNDGLLHVVAGTTQLLGGMSGQGGVCVDAGAGLAVHSNVSSGAVEVRGTLRLPGPSVGLTVSEALTFCETAALDAPSGARILMAGAALENHATVETALADLAGVELVFTGGPAVVNPFEVASRAGGGLVDNFALGTLVLGDAAVVRALGDVAVEPMAGATEVGRVQLVDLVDNRNRGPGGRECLFVSDLVIGPGSELDLNGLDLCIGGDATGLLSGWIAEGRLVDTTGRPLAAAYDDGSGWTAVPEPATLALLALGGLGVLLGRRR